MTSPISEQRAEPADPSRAGPGFRFFSGKGGVGKTTLAAACAVHLARAGQRVLITSTDPAHSLSDVFDRPIGDAGLQIEPNLFGLELDSSARWAAASDQLAAEPAARGRRGRLQRSLGDAVRLLGEAPGVDEFMSLELLIETMTSDAFDQVVFDTAPSGHTLRLLLLPSMLDGWVGKLLALRGAFSRVGRALRRLLPRQPQNAGAGFDQQLGQARERIGRARALISDPSRSRFALVTIPEAMSVLETQRTLEQLGAQGIPVWRVFANQVQPPSADCEHCRRRHAIHRRELERLADLLGPVPLQVVESKPHVIRGPEALAELGRELAG